MKRSLASIVLGVLSLAILAPALCGAAAPPEVATTEGNVRGMASDSFYTFRGIPYAAPPVGPLRWRAAQKPQPWKGVRPASEFGADCEQPTIPGAPPSPSMSEDCLTVNVLPPPAGTSKKLPLTMRIHTRPFSL